MKAAYRADRPNAPRKIQLVASGVCPMISFPCPKCQTTLKAPDEKAGARTKCSKCGCPVQVPSIPVGAPPVGAEVPPDATLADAPASGHTTPKNRKWWIGGAVAALMLFSCACCGCGGIFIGRPIWEEMQRPVSKQERVVVPLPEGVTISRGGFRNTAIGLNKTQVKTWLGGPPIKTLNIGSGDVWTYSGRSVNSDTGKRDREVNLHFRESMVHLVVFFE